MIKVNCEYKIKEDIGFIIEAEKINVLELSEATRISRTTFNAIDKRGSASKSITRTEIFDSMKFSRSTVCRLPQPVLLFIDADYLPLTRHLSGMKPRQTGKHKKFTIIISTLT